MMVILTGPLCLLCSYLAWLCYRRSFHKQALVISGFALLFGLLTVVVFGWGYYTWQALDTKTVATD